MRYPHICSKHKEVMWRWPHEAKWHCDKCESEALAEKLLGEFEEILNGHDTPQPD